MHAGCQLARGHSARSGFSSSCGAGCCVVNPWRLRTPLVQGHQGSMSTPVRARGMVRLSVAALLLVALSPAPVAACEGDSEAFSAGYGACSSYSPSEENHKCAMHACARTLLRIFLRGSPWSLSTRKAHADAHALHQFCWRMCTHPCTHPRPQPVVHGLGPSAHSIEGCKLRHPGVGAVRGVGGGGMSVLASCTDCTPGPPPYSHGTEGLRRTTAGGAERARARRRHCQVLRR